MRGSSSSIEKYIYKHIPVRINITTMFGSVLLFPFSSSKGAPLGFEVCKVAYRQKFAMSGFEPNALTCNDVMLGGSDTDVRLL